MKRSITIALAFVLLLMALIPCTAVLADTGVYSANGSKYLGPLPEQVTLTFSKGMPIKAYAVNVLDYVSDLSYAVEQSTEKISFGSTRGYYQKLKGQISQCHGLGVYLYILQKTSDKMGFKVGLLKNKKGNYGDYHSEVIIDSGSVGEVVCYNRETKEIDGFKNMICGVSSGSYYGAPVGLTLYFATESAAITYIRSIAY